LVPALLTRMSSWPQRSSRCELLFPFDQNKTCTHRAANRIARCRYVKWPLLFRASSRGRRFVRLAPYTDHGASPHLAPLASPRWVLFGELSIAASPRVRACTSITLPHGGRAKRIYKHSRRGPASWEAREMSWRATNRAARRCLRAQRRSSAYARADRNV
jgi:hypothetical protein